MTVERFLEVLNTIVRLESDLGIQRTLEGIADNLTSLASSPGQAAQQAALAQNLASLQEAANRLGIEISPADSEAVRAMGGEDFFDPDLSNKVADSIARNAITPSVARDFVQQLAGRRSSFLEQVRGAANNLVQLKVSPSTLLPGAADVSFLIPRSLFKNELESFSKELRFISKLFADYTEALTGHRENVELETLSSSVPTVALLAAAPVLLTLGNVVNKFLDAWKKIEEIRELRARTAALGIKKTAFIEFTDEITATVSRVIEEAVAEAIAHYQGEEIRKNELITALRQDTKRLFGQIERGLEIQFRAAVDEIDPASSESDLTKLARIAKILEFPKIADEPLLLSSGEVLEDESDAPPVSDSSKSDSGKTSRRKREITLED